MQNRLSMYLNVMQVLETNKEIWENIPGIADYVEKFRTQLEELKQMVMNLDFSTKPVTSEKHRVMSELTEEAIVLRGQLEALSQQEGDAELAAKIPKTRNELRNGTFIGRLRHMHQLIEIAEARLETLAKFGWHPEKQEQIRELWNNADAVINSPQQKQKELSLAREKINEMSAALSELLDKGLDSAMLVFRSEFPNFFKSWIANRAITDLRGTRRSSQESEEIQESEDQSENQSENESEYQSENESESGGGDPGIDSSSGSDDDSAEDENNNE